EKIPMIFPEIEQVVMTALAKDPKQRFGSVRAFANALQQAVQAEQAPTIISARPQTETALPVSQPALPQPVVPPPPKTNNSPSVSQPTLPQTNIFPSVRASSSIEPQGRQKWEFATDGLVTSSPIVANGIVYFGSGDHHLYALDAASGQQRWSFAA